MVCVMQAKIIHAEAAMLLFFLGHGSYQDIYNTFKLFKYADASFGFQILQDGRINYDEFCAMMRKGNPEANPKKRRELFV